MSISHAPYEPADGAPTMSQDFKEAVGSNHQGQSTSSAQGNQESAAAQGETQEKQTPLELNLEPDDIQRQTFLGKISKTKKQDFTPEM